MQEKKNGFWTECKDIWNENKEKVKIGLEALGIGFLIGFLKGDWHATNRSVNVEMELLKKIPDSKREIDDSEILFGCLKNQSKAEIDKIMDEMVEYGDMEP